MHKYNVYITPSQTRGQKRSCLASHAFFPLLVHRDGYSQASFAISRREKVKALGEKFVFSLKICICRLSLCVCRLNLYIFTLKINFMHRAGGFLRRDLSVSCVRGCWNGAGCLCVGRMCAAAVGVGVAIPYICATLTIKVNDAMTKDLFDKYIWFVDTIYRAGRITFA